MCLAFPSERFSAIRSLGTRRHAGKRVDQRLGVWSLVMDHCSLLGEMALSGEGSEKAVSRVGL